MKINLTKQAAKGIDQLLVDGSNIKNCRKMIINSLSKVDDGTAPRDKVLHGTEGVHSISLHNVNAFRGLVIYDKNEDKHVLVAAVSHKEYDKIINNPAELKKLKAQVQDGDHQTISFDENTKKFQNAYNQATLAALIDCKAELLSGAAIEQTQSLEKGYNDTQPYRTKWQPGGMV